ncbi:MAG: tetratricopeptide repeat protein, partial [Theionarchaea archaeon]|nr:tetratricopeptide repeat protein [Theionarchaea archaeon]
MSLVAEGFTIAILPKNKGYIVRVESPLGSKERFLKTDFQNRTYHPALREPRERLYSTYSVHNPLPEGSIKHFGEELFSTLFTKEMKGLFKKCFRQSIQENSPLRIILESSSPEVHQIPWEIMYCKEENLFLGSSPYVTFSRSIPDIPAAAADPVTPPMKVLVLVSSPLDFSDEEYEIDAGEVERFISTPLEELKSQGWITTWFTDDTRFDHIRTLLKKEWNIIHFVGHGFYDGEKTYILIEDDKRNRFSLPAEKVCDLFASRKKPNLILFNACESAQNPPEIYAGIPFTLLMRGFPAVIAMQYSVFVEVADTFVKYLYEYLGKTPVDKAVSEARMVLHQKYGEDTISWFTPVLYVCGLNPILEFEKGATAHPPEREKSVDFLTDLPRAEMFFGRKKYRIKIEKAFFEKKKRIVLMTGIGGIGKSSLAREFADRSRRRYKAVFAKKITADFNLKNFLEEFGEFLSENGNNSFKDMLNYEISTRGKLEYLCRSLDMGRYLIILDGFEEVMEDMKIKSEDMKTFLEAFINGKHRSNCIITSRHLVGGYEMENVDLGDLSMWSCQRILNERGVNLTLEETKEIYERVGGNPKYYELLSPIIKRMGRENLLKAIKKAREQIAVWILDELFSYSYHETEVLKRVSVFRIPFKRGALELAGGTDEGIELLLGLSLLKLDKLYSIHSMVRDYCRDKMTEKEKKAAHELSVKYYLQEKEDSKELLELHHHLLKLKKFEEAANITLRITDALTKQGYLGSALVLNNQALEGTSKKTKSTAYHNIGVIYQRRGEFEKALEYFDKSLEIKKKINDERGIAEVYHNIGMILRDRGEYEKALEYFDKNLKTFKEINDSRNIGRTYHQLGMIYQHKEEYKKAREYFDKSLEIFKEINDEGNTAAAYHHIGIIYQHKGDYKKAREYFDRNLKTFKVLHDVRGEAITYHQLGIIHQYEREYEKALKYFKRSLEIKERIDDKEAIGNTYGQLGRLYSKRKEYEKALKFLYAARDKFRFIQSPCL